MTIYKFAFFPKWCITCGRTFIFERYSKVYKSNDYVGGAWFACCKRCKELKK